MTNEKGNEAIAKEKKARAEQSARSMRWTTQMMRGMTG